MATMPPQPPGSQPPQPPAVLPSGPPAGPPSGPPQPVAGSYASATPAYAGQHAGAPTAVVRRRTGWMLFAQVLMIVKAIVWILFGLLVIGFGIYLIINGTAALSSLPGYQQYFSSAVSAYVNAIVGVFIGIGFAFLVIGVVGLILGIIVGRPSNAARWIAIVFTVLAALVWVAALISGLNHQTSNNNGWLFALVFLVTDVLIFYALAINANTRRAYAGKP